MKVSWLVVCACDPLLITTHYTRSFWQGGGNRSHISTGGLFENTTGRMCAFSSLCACVRVCVSLCACVCACVLVVKCPCSLIAHVPSARMNWHVAKSKETWRQSGKHHYAARVAQFVLTLSGGFASRLILMSSLGSTLGWLASQRTRREWGREGF